MVSTRSGIVVSVIYLAPVDPDIAAVAAVADVAAVAAVPAVADVAAVVDVAGVAAIAAVAFVVGFLRWLHMQLLFHGFWVKQYSISYPHSPLTSAFGTRGKNSTTVG